MLRVHPERAALAVQGHGPRAGVQRREIQQDRGRPGVRGKLSFFVSFNLAPGFVWPGSVCLTRLCLPRTWLCLTRLGTVGSPPPRRKAVRRLYDTNVTFANTASDHPFSTRQIMLSREKPCKLSVPLAASSTSPEIRLVSAHAVMGTPPACIRLACALGHVKGKLHGQTAVNVGYAEAGLSVEREARGLVGDLHKLKITVESLGPQPLKDVKVRTIPASQQPRKDTLLGCVEFLRPRHRHTMSSSQISEIGRGHLRKPLIGCPRFQVFVGGSVSLVGPDGSVDTSKGGELEVRGGACVVRAKGSLIPGGEVTVKGVPPGGKEEVEVWVVAKGEVGGGGLRASAKVRATFSTERGGSSSCEEAFDIDFTPPFSLSTSYLSLSTHVLAPPSRAAPAAQPPAEAAGGPPAAPVLISGEISLLKLELRSLTTSSLHICRVTLRPAVDDGAAFELLDSAVSAASCARAWCILHRLARGVSCTARLHACSACLLAGTPATCAACQLMCRPC